MNLILVLAGLLMGIAAVDPLIDASGYMWAKGDPFPWYYESLTTYVIFTLMVGVVLLGCGLGAGYFLLQKRVKLSIILQIVGFIVLVAQILPAI